MQSSKYLTQLYSMTNSTMWMRHMWSSSRNIRVVNLSNKSKLNKIPAHLLEVVSSELSMGNRYSDKVAEITSSEDISEACNLEDENDFRPCETVIHTPNATDHWDIQKMSVESEEMLMDWYAGGANAENAASLLTMKEGMKGFNEDKIEYAATEDWESAVASNAEDLPQCNLNDLMAQEAVAPEDDVDDAAKPNAVKPIAKNQDAGKTSTAV